MGGAKTTQIPDLNPQQIAQENILTSPQYQPEVKGMQDLNFLSWLGNAISGGTSQAAGQTNG